MHSAKVLVLMVLFAALPGCQTAAPPCVVQQGQDSRIVVLQREKDDTLYEIQLRQTEIDQMMSNAKRGVGVSHEWLERKAALTEAITQLQVKAHDLDLQIAAAK